MDGKTRRPARFGQLEETPAGSAPIDKIEPSTVPPTETAIARAADLPRQEPAPPAVITTAASVEPSVPPRDSGTEALAALAESQTALARGLEAMSAEVMALARTGIAITTRGATGLLGARSWSDALILGADLTRAGFDAVAGGSARLSELGTRLALDSTQPFINRFGQLRNAVAPPPGG